LNPARYNPVWLFGILTVPYGSFNAVITVLIPFLLRKHGVPVDRIAGVVAISAIPNFWYFLWSPVVDTGFLRKTWVLIAAGASALCAWIAILWASATLTQLTVLLFAGNVVSMLLSSSNGALLSTTIDPLMRGRAGGWYNAGNLGGGALGAGLAIWLAGFTPLPVLSVIVAALVFLPALAVLWIIEERVPRKRPGALFRALGSDVWMLLRAPATWLGLMFFLSPVGSAAVANLISSVGPDYHASDAEVAWVSGVAGGLVSALGCMLGGFLCDRMRRTTAYAAAGLFSAIFSGWMALGPASAFTYAGGYIGYSLTAGMAYAAFTALQLEVLGKRPHAAGTAYSLLGSSANLPIAYMTWVDGAAYKAAGRRGLMGVDALANSVIAVLLLVFARLAVRRWLPANAEPVLSPAKD
jgi:MFS transporter, PAT family, beta-lactamase induction signal transducer AmpG